LLLKSLELFIFRDLSELAVNPMGINMGPPIVGREEFDPRKRDHRRREMDRFNER
jgi:E3 ubiquitin-protein ligase RBBP6